MPLPQLREALSTDLNDGLSYTRLRRAYEKYGNNEFVKPRPCSQFVLFYSNCVGGIQTGLWIVTFTLFFANTIGIWDSLAPSADWIHFHAIRVPAAYYYLPFVTSFLIIINALILTLVPYHQSAAAKRFKMTTYRPIMVCREGKTQQIDARSLLPGDIVTNLRCPDIKHNLIIPADMRILEVNSDLYVSMAAFAGNRL